MARKKNPNLRHKIKKLMEKGLTQRQMSQVLGVSTNCVNRYAQEIASGIEERCERIETRRKQRRKKVKQEVLDNMPKGAITEEDAGKLCQTLFTQALAELTTRLPEMEDAEIKDLVLQMAGMFRD